MEQEVKSVNKNEFFYVIWIPGENLAPRETLVVSIGDERHFEEREEECDKHEWGGRRITKWEASYIVQGSSWVTSCLCWSEMVQASDGWEDKAEEEDWTDKHSVSGHAALALL